MSAIPLHPNGPDHWDKEDYTQVESELLPVEIWGYGSLWYWTVKHPALAHHVGPFPSGRAAFRNMKQWKPDPEP